MDLYEILSISNNATNKEIITAYKNLAKIYHPDKKTGSTEKFQEINYAYNILINDKTRLTYNEMKQSKKTNIKKFLKELFNNNKINIKNYINLNKNDIDNILNNIECYDFNDIINLFNNNIIPKKENNIINCSDSDTPYWDELSAEYYTINCLPIKYHNYNKNNIYLYLKCTLDDVENNVIRIIKIKRKQNNEFIETKYHFKCSHSIIVFNNGGDNNGHLIIYLSLPDNYIWQNDIIYNNMNISLFQYIYGLKINNINIIPYKDGNVINIKYINNYLYCIKLNIIYNHTIENKEMLLKIN